MKRHILLATLILSAGLSSCQASNSTTKVDYTRIGKTATEERDLGKFSKITVLADCDIRFSQSSKYKVDITAPQDILSQIQTENNNGTITIKEKQAVKKIAGVYMYRSSSSGKGVTIRISAPSLEKVQLIGNGDFDVPSSIKQDKPLDIELIGNGDMEFSSIKCPVLTTVLSGNGDIEIDNGETETSNITLAGNGDISFDHMKASNTLSIAVAGNGDVEVEDIETPTVSCNVTGNGEVKLAGKTITYNKAIVGTGSIHDQQLQAQNTYKGYTTPQKRTSSPSSSTGGINERP